MPEITKAEVNQLIKNLNSGLLIYGFKGMKTAFKFNPIQKGAGEFKTTMLNVGIDVPMSQRDIYGFFTDWIIWNNCLDVITNIAKHFPWIAERFDCDQRATFVKVLCDIFLGINSCGIAYGKIYKLDGSELGLHYFNFIVTADKKLYLYDIDFGNKGLVTGVDPIVGNNKYKIISTEFF